MRTFFLVLIAAGSCAAQTVTITSVSPQQVVMQIDNPTGSCLIDVSLSPSYSPVIPDVDSAIHSGSRIDTSRPDTVTWASGTRIVTIGHREDDRSMIVNTTYYYRLQGCPGTVTGQFTTSNIGTGMTRTTQVAFDSTRWGNMKYQPFDWTTLKSYVDPVTGVGRTPLALNHMTWRTGGGGGGVGAAATAFAGYTGGTSWTNPANILNGLTSTATTNNTNPIDLLVDWSTEFMEAYTTTRILRDVGVVMYGGGCTSTGANCNVVVDLQKHGVSCGITSTVPIGTGSMTAISSGSADPNGAWPAEFPKQPYYGWSHSVSPCLYNEDLQTTGLATVSSNTLTIQIGNESNKNHFNTATVAGDKIAVTNSSPNCTNNLCTAAGPPTDPRHITLVETPSTTGAQTYISYGWTIRITKATATGTVQLGAKYKLAGSFADTGQAPNTAGSDRSSKVLVTSGDGKQGYLYMLDSVAVGTYTIWFIATDGTARLLLTLGGRVSFSATIGNVFYDAYINGSGGLSLRKYTYNGNYTTNLDYNDPAKASLYFACSSNPACPTPASDADFTVADIMQHGSNMDLDQQIVAHQGGTLPPYNFTLFGHWNSGATTQFDGCSGDYCSFTNLYGGQGQPDSGSPGWVAFVNASSGTGVVDRLCDTLTGVGCPDNRFGSLHNTDPVVSFANKFTFTLDGLYGSSPHIMGGPFQTTVEAVLLADGVTWDPNSCLDYPFNSGSGCAHRGSNHYFTTCPGGTVTYSDCVTLKMKLPCNKNPSALELANVTVCPWNPSYTLPVTMIVGDNAVDTLISGASGTDNEHFRPLSITPDSGSTYIVVAARNAVYEYCSKSPWHALGVNPTSIATDAQQQHADQWTWTMMPGHRHNVSNTCGAAINILDVSTSVSADMGHFSIGHFHLGAGPTPGNASFITTAKTAYNQAFSLIDQVPPVLNSTAPTFNGNPAFIGSGGSLQSYTDASHDNGGASLLTTGIDTNDLACAAEGVPCGPPMTYAHVTGDIYKISLVTYGATPNEAFYKQEEVLGAAGQYILKDVSGPSCNVDAAPYTMGFVMVAGQCHAGSSVNDLIINVPQFWNPDDHSTLMPSNTFSPGQDFGNNPGTFAGFDAPGGFTRQYQISTTDTSGLYSRAISSGWSSYGRNFPFAYATFYPSGGFLVEPSHSYTDGHSFISWITTVPAWAPDGVARNSFYPVPVTVPVGNAYARVRFGYGEFGLPTDMFCTAYQESCVTDPNFLTSYAFVGAVDTKAPIATCAGGCTININAISGRILFYRIERSTDGSTWNTSGDIQALSVAPVAPPVAPPTTSTTISSSAILGLGVVIH